MSKLEISNNDQNRYSSINDEEETSSSSKQLLFPSESKLLPLEIINPEDKTDKNNEELQNEPKTYLNCYICQISIGIIFTYLYLFGSIMLNVINRRVFISYKFHFNFTYMWLQQVFCLTFFSLASKTKKFKIIFGELSFKDFLKNKKSYIKCVITYILNNLTSFYGTRLVSNMAMFLTFRKLNLVIIYIIDVFISKKKITLISSLCIILITLGSIISGVDKFSTDYLGIMFVLINDFFTIIYTKQTENFKKNTGLPNVKLLVYNSFLSFFLMGMCIFITGEFSAVKKYFFENEDFDKGVITILIISGCFVVLLNSSFFISNEKNSSLFTNILVNCKDIFVSLLSYFWLKESNLSVCNIVGLGIAIVGAFVFSFKSFCDNFKIGK